VQDPQINHRQMIVDVEHPTHGRVRQFGIAIKLSDTPGSVRSAAPLSNEHTDAVLKELGFGVDAIAGLRARKVVE
jgi:crotonobetainyl-CoA:carnitine CoA-transferase CaiB-like acyl-CoA transferase